MPFISDEFIADVSVHDPELNAILHKLAFRSSVVVPLTARGRTFGALSLVTTAESGRHLSRDDVRLAQELGRSAALAVCKKGVEFHRGRIWAESVPGKSTTFYFTVPVDGQ